MFERRKLEKYTHEAETGRAAAAAAATNKKITMGRYNERVVFVFFFFPPFIPRYFLLGSFSLTTS